MVHDDLAELRTQRLTRLLWLEFGESLPERKELYRKGAPEIFMGSPPYIWLNIKVELYKISEKLTPAWL